jgi:hypothetical protein
MDDFLGKACAEHLFKPELKSCFADDRKLTSYFSTVTLRALLSKFRTNLNDKTREQII